MPKHPTVEIPNIGPMDHAWDLLGEWLVEVEHPDLPDGLTGRLTFASWTEGELEFDPFDATMASLPTPVHLERASRVHLTDAGGGALQWVLLAPAVAWLAQATLWPGSLHFFVQDADDEDRHLFRVHAGRTREYYNQKYPLVPR